MKFDEVLEELRAKPRTWLVTGAAGFIGSHLVEALLGAGQRVTGLDNFATGHRANLEDVQAAVGREAWSNFSFIEGDIRNLEDCRRACAGAACVLHEAALASVPESIKDPITANQCNVDGFLNLLMAGRDSGVRRLVYASSSAVYGDLPGQPKREDQVGPPLSPYALGKRVDEMYAELFASAYGLDTVGLRYFNVFGRRQDPHGAYAAVIPQWIASLLRFQPCLIHGTGETTRDFCHVGNIVQGNLLAALVGDSAAVNQIYNLGCGGRITLTELEAELRALLAEQWPGIAALLPIHTPFRPGDILHSQADVDKAKLWLGYQPQTSMRLGLQEVLSWYSKRVLDRVSA